MSNGRVVFYCSSCDTEFPKYFVKCSKCGDIGTAEEKTVSSGGPQSAGTKAKASSGELVAPKKISDFKESKSSSITRLPTNIGELDRVIGGGMVPKEVLLIGGVPGAGKSTISAQLCGTLAERDMNVWYFSGEESEEQVSMRFSRLGIFSENISIVHTSSLDDILSYIDSNKPDFFVVDSLQMVATKELSGSMGSLQQSKEAANVLNAKAKDVGSMALLISQVNKGEDFAGNMSIQHVVDCILFFEGNEDSPLKFLRASKNRFGSTDEVGIFQHTESGLEGVTDPSGLFSDEETVESQVGVAHTALSEGKRQLLVEIQSLVTASQTPRQKAQYSGVDYNRTVMVTAILDKYCGTGIQNKDSYISTGAGIRVVDPLTDLGVAAALMSSCQDKAYKEGVGFVGELSLSGKISGGTGAVKKIQEMVRMGFTTIVAPKSTISKIDISSNRGVSLIGVSNVKGFHSLSQKLFDK